MRSLTDCLIAVIAVRNDAPLWHCDADILRIAEVTPLRQLDLR